MINLVRTDSDNSDFRELVRLLDKELQIRDGDDHPFYAQFNKIDKIRHVVVAYEDGEAVGCGAFKEYAAGIAEIKRMFVREEMRGRGIAQSVLAELETWADELGFSECILETGWKQPEAIGLYRKCGYKTIPNYGQYSGLDKSTCMKKVIRKVRGCKKICVNGSNQHFLLTGENDYANYQRNSRSITQRI